MSIQTITDALLLELKKSGIQENTIRKNYACFYRSFCKEAGKKKLEERTVAAFLLNKQGKDIFNLDYYQLSRWEQVCKHAFQVLLEYQVTGQLNIKCKKADNPESDDIKVLNEYLLFCTDAGNTVRTLNRKQATIRRFLTAYSLDGINSSSILAYVQSFAGKSAYYLKRELDEIRKFMKLLKKSLILQLAIKR